MSIEVYISSITTARELIVQLLETEFKVGTKLSGRLFEGCIEPHFKTLKSSTYLLVETQYVDRTYRDSYYNYFSSKSNHYIKNCIRISVFDGVIEESDFRNLNKYSKLLAQYRGFYVLRPTFPYVMGRTIISPRCLKESNFSCCITHFNTSAHGLKFSVDGFPHSSQDTETVTCAETSLWAIMQYFGNKYPWYIPALPSKIIEVLNTLAVERQIPSQGLSILKMSYALKQFGFGNKIYSKKAYDDFEQILSCYIESGIPLIIYVANNTVKHALLAIGHENVDTLQIDNIPPNEYEVSSGKKLTIYDYDSIKKKFIFIDDNRPVYQKATLDNPTIHYTDKDWDGCVVNCFIVPLYPRIYLDAFEAKKFITLFLQAFFKIPEDTEIVLRTFLASSRSFKAKLALNDSFTSDAKTIVMQIAMPKFIWVAEISDKELIKNKTATGLILLDATEAIIKNFKPLILGFLQEKMLSVNKISGILQLDSLTLGQFKIYEQNLENYSNDSASQ